MTMTKHQNLNVKNPYDVIIEPINVRLGALRDKSITISKDSSQFRRIQSNRSRHTMLVGTDGKDGTAIAYHVPAQLTNFENLTMHLTELIKTLPRLPPWKLKKNLDSQKCIANSRVYTCWTSFQEDQKPHMSSQYIVDGEEAKNFIKECAPLWKKAGEILQVVFRKTYKKYTNYPLPDGLTHLAEAWMGMAVNEGCKEDPVVSDKHQDRNDAFYGVSCVCAFGDYEGGDLICWELKVIVELKPGDMFFFPAHLITHSNTEVKGERHSLVAFTQQKVLNWFEQRYNCVDDRDIARGIKRQKKTVDNM